MSRQRILFSFKHIVYKPLWPSHTSSQTPLKLSITAEDYFSKTIHQLSMDFSWPVFQRGRTSGASWSHRSYSIGFSSKKPSGVIVEIHSTAQWKACMKASIENDKLLVIEFTANWCGPCRFVEPIMKELAATYTDVDFIKIDVDEMPGIAQQFDVQILPTFFILRKGKEVDRVTGVKMKELQNKIEIARLP